MTSNPFTSINLVPNFSNGHTITWSIDPLFEDPQPHKFFLEVTDEGTFTVILYVLDVGNKNFVKDIGNTQQNYNSTFYYRVRLETPTAVYYSEPVSSHYSKPSRRQFLIANEIIRKELLRHKKFTGSEVVVLKRKLYGPQVSDATVDPISGVALTDQSSDHGNIITRGYYDPVIAYMSPEHKQNINRLDPNGAGVIANLNATVRFLPYPILTYNDIVIERDQDLRYIVKDSQDSLYPGTNIVLAQTIELSLLPTSDPVYSINIDNG